MSLPASPRRGRGFDRKTMQLCKHVARELNQILSGECGDDLLRELMVVDVQPLDGAAQLLVIVQPYDLEKQPERFKILNKLNAVKGKLRFAIGETISRRKVPDLIFRLSGVTSDLEKQLHEAELAELPPVKPFEDADDEVEGSDELEGSELEAGVVVDAIEGVVEDDADAAEGKV